MSWGGGITGAVLASNTSSSNNTTQNTSSVLTPEEKEKQIVALNVAATTLTDTLDNSEVSVEALTMASNAVQLLIDKLPSDLVDDRINNAKTKLEEARTKITELEQAKETQIAALVEPTSALTTALEGLNKRGINSAKDVLQEHVNNIPEGWTDARIDNAKTELGKVKARIDAIDKETQISALVAPTQTLTTALEGSNKGEINTARDALQALVNNIPEGWTDTRIDNAKSKISSVSARLDELTTSAEKETQIAALVAPTQTLTTALEGSNKGEINTAKDALQPLVNNIPEGWTDTRIDNAKTELQKVEARINAIDKETQIAALVTPTETLSTATEGTNKNEINTARNVLQTLVNNIPEGWTDTRINTAKSKLSSASERLDELTTPAEKQTQINAIEISAQTLTLALEGQNLTLEQINRINVAKDALQALVNNIPEEWKDEKITKAKAELAKVPERIDKIKEGVLVSLERQTILLIRILESARKQTINATKDGLQAYFNTNISPTDWVDDRITAAKKALEDVPKRIAEIDKMSPKELQLTNLSFATETAKRERLRSDSLILISILRAYRSRLQGELEEIPESWMDQRITAAKAELAKLNADQRLQ